MDLFDCTLPFLSDEYVILYRNLAGRARFATLLSDTASSRALKLRDSSKTWQSKSGRAGVVRDRYKCPPDSALLANQNRR